jgi:hypothetical protein
MTGARYVTIGWLMYGQVGFWFLTLDFWAVRHLHNDGAWIVAGGMGLAATIFLGWLFARTAREKGYSMLWGVMGLFGFLGWVVIFLLLPDRSSQRGFPVQPIRHDPPVDLGP